MRTLIMGLLLAAASFAQQGTPDCQFTGTFTSATAGTAFNNKITSARCVSWRMTYWTNGASGVSITLQGGTDVAGVAGSYSTLTATQGSSNPATGTTQGTVVACCDYYPWIRVNVGTFTGSSQTMSVVAYGWKAPDTGPTATSSGGATSNVNVAQYGGVATAYGQAAMAGSIPVVVASNQTALPASQSGTWTVQPGNTPNTAPWLQDIRAINGTASYGCGSQAVISLSGSGNTQIIAASGSTVIRICHISLSTTPAENIAITAGTGANCAAGTTTLAGSYPTITGFAFDFGPFSPLSGGASNAVCINQQNAQTTTGVVIYDQR